MSLPLPITEESFTTEYTAHHSSTARYLRRIGSPNHMLEDYVQSAWTRAWEKRSEYSGLSTFASWVCAIARNIFLSDVRTMWYKSTINGVRSFTLDHVDNDRQNSLDQMLQLTDNFMSVKSITSKLYLMDTLKLIHSTKSHSESLNINRSATVIKFLYLTKVEGIDSLECANSLGIELNTVKVWAMRMRHKLKHKGNKKW